ncbi:MAG: hypothetical protein EHM93_18130 [Bacteroidales bacterium]|nr:MAG: hypothetical protein EHM93_18130 [Bacteroidales bacterium]
MEWCKIGDLEGWKIRQLDGWIIGKKDIVNKQRITIRRTHYSNIPSFQQTYQDKLKHNIIT